MERTAMSVGGQEKEGYLGTDGGVIASVQESNVKSESWLMQSLNIYYIINI